MVNNLLTKNRSRNSDSQSTGPLRDPSRSKKRIGYKRSGYTLLEVILAISLSFFIVVTIGTMINLNINILDRQQKDTERRQLIRTIMMLIGNDLRATIQYKEFDTSALDETLASLLGGALPVDEETDEDEGPSRPGLYGTEFELIIDISRLPRRDQYDVNIMSKTGSIVDFTSDLKSVSYYVAGPTNNGDSATDRFGNTLESGSGLVRRENDRAIASYALDNGTEIDFDEAESIISPEVQSISFRYFDGEEWLTEWDSEEEGRLPSAVEINLVVSDGYVSPVTSSIASNDDTNLESHRMVVYLPIAEVVTAEDLEEAE